MHFGRREELQAMMIAMGMMIGTANIVLADNHKDPHKEEKKDTHKGDHKKDDGLKAAK